MDRAEMNSVLKGYYIAEYHSKDKEFYPLIDVNRPLAAKMLSCGEFFSPVEGDIIKVADNENPPLGWYMTHRKKGYDIYVRTIREDGSFAVFIGATAHRVYWRVIPSVWVGQCTYLSYFKYKE